MKIFCFIVTVFFFTTKCVAQPQWAGLGVRLNYGPTVMYYDSTTDRSYIAGAFSTVDDTACNVLCWNGSSRVLLPSSPLYTTNALIRFNGSLYAGGAGLARFNGTTWEHLDSTHAIHCFKILDGKLLVGGTFDSLGGVQTGPIASWDGATFSDVYRADALFGIGTGYSVLAIEYYKGNLYLAGNFQDLQDSSIQEIVRFDGERWRNVGGQIHGDGFSLVSDLLVLHDTLYVSGLFYENSGSAGNAIASWDGQNWHRLGRGFLPEMTGVSDLEEYRGALYATGTFSIMDGVDLGSNYKGLVTWDGAHWCSTGASANFPILYMGKWRDQLYVLGNFVVINEDSVTHIGQWLSEGYTDTCSIGTLTIPEPTSDGAKVVLYPNPATNDAYVDFPRKMQVHIRLFAASGALIQVLDVFDDHVKLLTAGLPEGIYYLDIQSEVFSIQRKLIKVSR